MPNFLFMESDAVYFFGWLEWHKHANVFVWMESAINII